MKIVTTFHQPSSVLCSVKCHLGSSDVEHLVVGKLNRLVVYSIQPHGLQQECTTEVWGKVLSVKAIPIPRSSRSNLVLMIAHPDPELIFFTYIEPEGGAAELVVKKQLALYERTPRPAEFFNDILVHPSGQLAVVSCYTGKLKIIKLKAGSHREEFDVLLPELNVFSLAFLPTPEFEYSIAILYLDNRGRLQLHARDIFVEDLELSAYSSSLLQSTVISDKVFPFPAEIVPRLLSVPALNQYADVNDDEFRGGVLVVGGKKVLLYELAAKEAQQRQKGKRRRLEARKSSSDVNEAAKAMEKEKEREGRKRKPKASVEWPWSEVAACSPIDREPLRYLIGDTFGKLSLLSVEHVNDLGLLLVPLGETSPATTLTYLTSQALYVGSHLGDSQVVELSPAPVSSLDTPTLSIPPHIKTVSPASLISSSKGKEKEELDENNMDVDDEVEIGTGSILATKGSFLTVLETHKNIAPIVDAALVDVDGAGQRQIVTCSGGKNTGSLNIVRNGADFQELAHISGLTNVTNVWPVKVMLEDEVHSHVLVSTLQSTALFKINETGEKPSLTYVVGDALSGLRTDVPTLAFANVVRRVYPSGASSPYENSSLAVQVTPHGVFLLQLDTVIGAYSEMDRWVPENPDMFGGKQRDIGAASVNVSQVAVAVNGGTLVMLTIAEKDKLRMISAVTGLAEISAVSCIPLNSSSRFTNHVVVSYWGKNAIEVLKPSKDGFVSLCKTSPLPSIVRSLLLYNFGFDSSPREPDHHPYLLVGLGDGSLVTFAWRDKELKEKKLVSLGHAPITFSPCPVEGKRAILAAGNRATLLSFDKKRLQYSPVSLKDISAVAHLNIPTFADSVMLATPTGISIGRVSDLDKLHIRTIPFGLDNPRRIVHEPTTKVFGIACTHTTPARMAETEVARSSFVLLDDVTYTEISRFWCEQGEEITSVTTFIFKDGDKNIPLFCVGTYRYDPEETEPIHGRILVFATMSADPGPKQFGMQLSLLSSASVKGCVYSLATVDNSVVAAVNSSVELYQLGISDEDTSTRAYTLKHLAAWNHNYIVANLATFGNYILVGDQISSISLVKVIDNTLKSVARDYGPLWPISIDASSETDIIAANDALNLYTFALSCQTGRTILERNGNWHLADLVTKFIRGSLLRDMEEDAPFVPSEIFFTSSGRIGIVLDINGNELPIQLTALERNLAYVVKGVGGESHTRYRAPKNTRGRTDADVSATGFLDGDFIEHLLTLVNSPENIDKVIAGNSAPERLTVPIADLQKVVETLQSMH
ncbi:hypothetical protein AX17_005211 [Amanita inopinata Kibby_2008]|nr:hypothetical protein AX17_005211 [Amanita inopinata Kibby_2008]